MSQYNYNLVMHYTAKAFPENSEETIIAPAGKMVGQQVGLLIPISSNCVFSINAQLVRVHLTDTMLSLTLLRLGRVEMSIEAPTPKTTS